MTDAQLTAMSFRQKLYAMLGLCFVLIMVALDQTVIGTALPTVIAELHGFDLYAWAGTAYLLTSVITVPIFGKLGDEHGRKPFVLAAITLFTAASVLCGFAQSMLQLVLARGLQGVGGGMLIATTFASVPDLFPDARERLRWQVLFSSAFGLANAIGPTLGGYLSEYWGWRSVFFVNLPVGVLSLWFVGRYLPHVRHGDEPPAQLDWLGALLIALALGSLQLLVEWLPLHKPTLWLVALAVLCIGASFTLYRWEARASNPVVPLELFRHGTLGPLFALSLLLGFCLYALLYYTPLLLQGGFALSPNRAGLLMTPLMVCITVSSILNARLVTRMRVPNRMLYVGLLLFGLCVAGLTQTGAAASAAQILALMTLGGLGLGILLPSLTIFTQACTARAQLGIATALLQSTRMVGGMIGTALIGVLITHRYAAGVNLQLAAAAEPWASWLNDPQILVSDERAGQFAIAAGSLAGPLLEHARSALIGAIHSSQWLILACVLLAILLIYRIPVITLRRPAIQAAEATETPHE